MSIKRLNELLNVQHQTLSHRNKAFQSLIEVTDDAYRRRSWLDQFRGKNDPSKDSAVIRATNFVDKIDSDLKDQETIIRQLKSSCDLREATGYKREIAKLETALSEEVAKRTKIDPDQLELLISDRVFHLERELEQVKEHNLYMASALKENTEKKVKWVHNAADGGLDNKLFKTSDYNNAFDVDTLQEQIATARTLAVSIGAASMGMQDFNQYSEANHSDTAADIATLLITQLDNAMGESDKIQLAIVGEGL